jgi:phosphoglycerol transferase
MSLQHSSLDHELRSQADDSQPFSIQSLLPYFVAAVLSCVLVAVVWHIPRVDLTVPLGIVGDHSFSQAVVTNFLRTGHLYVNPSLGAPGQQELYDYPLPHWLHFGVLALVRLFTRNPGLAINLLFFLGYPLATLTALYALRRLGVSTGLAVTGGLLYAFIPFHHLRNEAHLFYSGFFMVPLLALVAVWIATGRTLFRFGPRAASSPGRIIAPDGLLALIACILIAWDNPYNAFFGVCLLAMAALLNWIRHKDGHAVVTAAILIVVLSISFFVGLSPNLLYVRSHGHTATAQRVPAESEIYGMTLIQMVAPVGNHRIPALARWKDRFRSQAVLVNENETAALGIIGTLGCLALFFCLLWPRCPEEIFALSVLNLVAFLIGTIGGLGAVFSFVISPQLRGFNRISVFISFFCIAGFLLLLSSWLLRRLKPRESWIYTFVVPALLLGVGIFDQVPRGLMAGHDQVERQYRNEAEFIRRIESMAPPGSMIFELPFDPFPETPPIEQMSDYEELRGYLHSSSLRWSYGAMRGRPTSNWLGAISAEPAEQMLLAVATSGFAGIILDRAGYADRGAAIEGQIAGLLGAPPITDQSLRLSFFLLDQSAVASLNSKVPPEHRVNLESFVHPLLLDVGAGCYGKEVFSGQEWHWCSQHGSIEILNTSSAPQTVVLDANFSTYYPDFAELDIEGVGESQKLRINNAGTNWQTTLTVPPGESTIRLSSDAKAVFAPTDPRDMHFRVNNLQIREKGRQ